MAQNATTGTAGHAGLAFAGMGTQDMGRRLFVATMRRVQRLFSDVRAGAFDSYRPELHYMRGPGPKWREKHGMTARSRRG
jgi:hypothetical protein